MNLFYLILIVQVCFFLYVDVTTASYDGNCSKFKLKNGRMRRKPTSKLVVRFQCNKGFMLAGHKYGVCMKDKFNIEPPVCVKKGCTKINAIKNAIVITSYDGAVANVHCKSDFKPNGQDVTYCDGQKWSNNLATCIAYDLSEPPRSCDFESEDLCGWSHDINHDFDWRRQNFETPSGHIGTGPKFDHTKGPHKDGYYVYVESTSRLVNDKARLISPVYTKMPEGMCFAFYYHMFGKDMGTLNVYVKKESVDLADLKPSFSLSGNQGDAWRRGIVSMIDGINEDFQIILEGIRGASYVSDIAVDDVELLETCPEEWYTSTSSSPLYEETIDSFPSCENFCGLSNEFCGCEDNCLVNDTCCPDFLLFCGPTTESDDLDSTSTDDYSTTSYDEILQETSTFQQVSTTKIIPAHKPVILPLNNSDNKQTFSVSTVSVKPLITTKQLPPKVVITLLTTIKTTVKSPTPSTQKIPTQQTVKNILKPATTPRVPIVKKITSLFTTTTAPLTHPHYMRHKETTVEPIKIVKPHFELTTSSFFDKKIRVTPPTGVIDVNESNLDDSIEVETDFDVSTKKTTLEPNVQFLLQNGGSGSSKIQVRGLMNNNSILMISIVSTIVILCSVAIVLFALVKLKFTCKNIKFRNKRNNESMSDVRFLTSDEVLDFAWRQE